MNFAIISEKLICMKQNAWIINYRTTVSTALFVSLC
jgi:hypothetical protein